MVGWSDLFGYVKVPHGAGYRGQALIGQTGNTTLKLVDLDWGSKSGVW